MITTIKNIYSQYKLLINCCLLIILAWTVNLLVLVGDKTDRGTFGDMFGGLNALFTGLAFATLIYTAWMQKEELALQRDELKDTREVLAGQREQLEQQSNTFELQRFESTLFTLLSVHRENAATVYVSGYYGREAMSKFRELLVESHQRFRFIDTEDDEVLRSNIHRDYDEVYSRSNIEIAHYFRHLYHIFKFIHSSNVKNKKWYASIVRAQLSNLELVILFYNCLSMYGQENFKPLIEEYQLLNNLKFNLLMQQAHIRLYNEKAFW